MNRELSLAGKCSVESFVSDIIDSLKLARSIHPGKRNSLDALCNRYGIDNSIREFHGAILDAELLGKVYLCMTRGQDSMDFNIPCEKKELETDVIKEKKLKSSLVKKVSSDEYQKHLQYLVNMEREGLAPIFEVIEK